MEANDRDRLDRWLDSALREYSNVEPRAGLETRILANLAARNRVVARRRWAWSFATAAAVCAIFLAAWFGAGLHHRGNVTVASSQQPITRKPAKVPAGGQALPPRGPNPVQVRDAHHGRKPARVSVEAANAPPRLEQFPSQRPLSEQERLLVSYVKEFPREAVEVAREQSDREKELDALYSSNRMESSLDQER